jgi:hypothetical protein
MMTDMTISAVHRSTTSITGYGVLRTNSTLHMTVIVTTILPLPHLPSTTCYTRAAVVMPPLPPLPSHASPIASTPHDKRKLASSSIAYNATYENLFTFFVVAYLLWALFYGIYLLLRAIIWFYETACEMSNTLFTISWTLHSRPLELRYRNEMTDTWIGNDVLLATCEPLRLARLVPLSTWIMPSKLEGQGMRQRSGTV